MYTYPLKSDFKWFINPRSLVLLLILPECKMEEKRRDSFFSCSLPACVTRTILLSTYLLLENGPWRRIKRARLLFAASRTHTTKLGITQLGIMGGKFTKMKILFLKQNCETCSLDLTETVYWRYRLFVHDLLSFQWFLNFSQKSFIPSPKSLLKWHSVGPSISGVKFPSYKFYI